MTKTLYKISQNQNHVPKPYKPFGGDINNKVYLFNYATITDLKKSNRN